MFLSKALNTFFLRILQKKNLNDEKFIKFFLFNLYIEKTAVKYSLSLFRAIIESVSVLFIF